jgi:4-amino-4-deoxy-L-arabinose transferase-like glycosyltransferase
MMTNDVATDARDETATVPAGGRSTAGRAGDLMRRAYTGMRQETLLVAVLAGSFLARWLTADRFSYWLDELYSVAVYGIWNDSASAAIQNLATSSVHPPLYQIVLYNWMQVFGDGERATRSLSNLYLTLATLFLYLLVRTAMSRRVALWSAVIFALMHSTTYFSLETRSYSQTMFLATLSSYTVLRMMRVASARGWHSAVFSGTAALFMGANIGLLLTHYFNVFFYVAQGVMAGIFAIAAFPRQRRMASLGTVTAMYAIQGIAFAVLWGDVFRRTYGRVADDYTVEELGLRSPVALLRTAVGPNIDLPGPVWWIAAALAAGVAVRAVSMLRGRLDLTPERLRSWSILYLFGWLLVPMVVMFVAFAFTGSARYNVRYVQYAVPALAPLFVLTLDEAGRLISAALRRLRGINFDPTAWVNVALAVLVVVSVVPGTLRAANTGLTDYRGVALRIVRIIESNPDATYVVLDTSFRTTSVLDYYLARYSGDVRVAGTIRRAEETLGTGFEFEGMQGQIQQYDFLVVSFAYHSTRYFPKAIEKLTETYPVYLQETNSSGQGYIIFLARPRDG